MTRFAKFIPIAVTLLALTGTLAAAPAAFAQPKENDPKTAADKARMGAPDGGAPCNGSIIGCVNFSFSININVSGSNVNTAGNQNNGTTGAPDGGQGGSGGGQGGGHAPTGLGGSGDGQGGSAGGSGGGANSPHLGTGITGGSGRTSPGLPARQTVRNADRRQGTVIIIPRKRLRRNWAV
jgi:hypothetical protein